MNVRIADVAAAANVSISTASRVLAGRGETTSATRARILEAAHDLGYQRGTERRGRPRSRGAFLIDLVMGQFHDPWTDEITAGARTAAAHHGYDLVLTVERDHPDDDWPSRIRSRNSAGVVAGLIRPTHDQLAILEGARIPVVLLEPPTDLRTGLTSVGATDWQGGFDAAAHLIACGLRELVVIADQPHYRYGRERIRGFREAVERLAPDIHLTVLSHSWSDSMAEQWMLRNLFAGRTSPVGVFALTHYIARSVYAAAAMAHLRIPEDVSVIGFDDTIDSKYLLPPLTTMHQPLRKMAAAAVDIVVRTAEGAPLPGERIELSTSLILRSSTSGVPLNP
jgi:LacI family transcriptional regulator